MFVCDMCERARDDARVPLYGYDSLCTGCRKQIEDGLLVDTEMKIYHWPSVVTLESHETGEVIVVAPSLESAFESIAVAYTYDDGGDLLSELERKSPLIYPVGVENPWAALIEGGA